MHLHTGKKSHQNIIFDIRIYQNIVVSTEKLNCLLHFDNVNYKCILNEIELVTRTSKIYFACENPFPY